MTNYKRESCDVLILGGGIGGLSCAVSVKEHNPDADVLVVEKNFAGYAGKANRGGGVLQYFPDRVDPWGFAVFHAKNIGADFTDQVLMARYVSQNSAMIDKLESWGVNIPRNPDGSLNVMPTGPMTAMICVDLDITVKVRRTAEKKGVRFLDKTVMADLLGDASGVTGAVVFSVLDGAVTAISAKKVVLATGSQDYRIGSMWGSGRGDGILAAYRLGAEMRNTEFGNFAQLARYRSHNEVVFGENFMYNAKGEHITKNFQQHRETDISSKAIREWYTQIKSGSGPVHLEFGQEQGGDDAMERQWDRPYGKKFRMLNDETARSVDTDLEVAPLFIGEQSPIKVDHNMKTTVEGLYAIGDCSYCGSGLAGAVPAPPGRNRGSGILNAVFAALECANEVGQADLSGALPALSETQIDAAASRITAPMERAEGVRPEDVIELVQKAMGPVEQSVIMHADRMAKAMTFVEQAKALLPKMRARDLHESMKCIEAEAMVLSAEMHYRASMMRKESRGWFLREDYPEQDNVNWEKYIVVKNVNGEMTLTTEPVDTAGWIYTPEHLVAVSDAVKNGPLNKYYRREMVAPDPRRYAVAAAPADPEKGLAPWDLNKLFDPGYLDLEAGFCQMPDGGAMLANLTDMPNVTPEMFDFWFAWHGLEEGRYTIWDREDHYSAVSRNPERGNDKSLSMKERYWDTTHDVFEDCGLGPERIVIGFRNPADIGFDPEKLKDFKGTIVCSGGEQAPVIMCHFLRPKADGRGYELRSRFWFGYHVVNGKPEKLLPDGVQFPLMAVQALLAHNIKEFTNLAAILPEVYAEFIDSFR
ncbi:MAG: FAD-dependent oxidoreductase [Oscillospiraceae bacterium]|nr:FAD-dependent oxidoreductase [Oscillospiraceae bacterium]